MNKSKIAIILGTVCMLLTISIAVQMRTIEKATNTVGTGISDNSGLKDEFLKNQDEYNTLYKKLEEAEKKLEEVRNQATQNNDSLRDVFNSILENEYGNVKSAYYEYIETGSENDREKLVQSAETLQNKLKNSIHNGDYSFKNSKFAYALLRDPDGNFIDYETLDPNLEVYEAVGLNVDGSFESGDVLYDGAFFNYKIQIE